MLARPLLDRRQCSFAIVTTNPMIFLHFERLMGNSETGAPLHPALPYTGAEAVWAAREEMARTVEDVLARRTRALFPNATAAIAMAPRVADLLARELGRDHQWKCAQMEAFHQTSRNYLLAPP